MKLHCVPAPSLCWIGWRRAPVSPEFVVEWA